MFTKFLETYEGRHNYARGWSGRGVMGYMCTYVPEELVYAAGFLPVRIVGTHQPESVTSPYLFNMFCSYCRDILAQGLLGKYSYLKAIIHTSCCEKIRNAFDAWERHVPGAKTYYLYMPQCVAHRGVTDVFYQEVVRLKEETERDWGLRITPADLDRAIEIYNQNRSLTHQVYQLTKGESPILGQELMSLTLASQVMDKAEHSALVQEFLKEVKPRKGIPSGVRTMVVGQTDSLALVELLDSLDARVVVDENCFGARYFWNPVIPNGDRLWAIASRYVERPPCPVKDGQDSRKRLPFILDLAKEWRVGLVVLVYPKFCDCHSYDAVAIKGAFKQQGIEVLELESDTTLPVEQFRTRIQATLEMLAL